VRVQVLALRRPARLPGPLRRAGLRPQEEGQEQEEDRHDLLASGVHLRQLGYTHIHCFK
jgi:hypothetical protein